jgi:hypothetical protein
MCKANLGYEQLSYYLPTLIDKDLISQDIENGFVVYRTTENGREYLEYYIGIVGLLSQVKSHRLSGGEPPQSSQTYGSNFSKDEPLISTIEETDN